MDRLQNGMIVSHFKRSDSTKFVDANTSTKYLYRILNMNVRHTETKERLVMYEALYNSEDGYAHIGDVFARPYDMFMSEVDRDKYPNATQQYRFEEFKF